MSSYPIIGYVDLMIERDRYIRLLTAQMLKISILFLYFSGETRSQCSTNDNFTKNLKTNLYILNIIAEISDRLPNRLTITILCDNYWKFLFTWSISTKGTAFSLIYEEYPT